MTSANTKSKWPLDTYGPTTRLFAYGDIFYYSYDPDDESKPMDLKVLDVGDTLSVKDFDRHTRIYEVMEKIPSGLVTKQIKGKPVQTEADFFDELDC